MNNEVQEFIVKIKNIYDKNLKVRQLLNLQELIECLEELNNLVEMYSVKSVILKHIQTLIVLNLKSDKLNVFDNHLLHTVFYGHPGVGKSKTAKILAKIWKSLGVIKSNAIVKNNSTETILSNINTVRNSYLDLFEKYIVPKYKECKLMWRENESLWKGIRTDISSIGEELATKLKNNEDEEVKEDYIVVAGRENFVAEYTGQTAIKTYNFLKSCFGKCVIIEEAYLLYNGEMDTFGMEALTVLNRFMDEYPRDVIIIFTGYEDKLRNSIFKVQPGLKRRCQWLFNLIGYTPEGLAKIFISQLKNNGWCVEDESRVIKFFENNHKNFENFGGDTEKLAFQCKMIYSDFTIKSMFENNGSYTLEKIITQEIIEKAYELYLSNRF